MGVLGTVDGPFIIVCVLVAVVAVVALAALHEFGWKWLKRRWP